MSVEQPRFPTLDLLRLVAVSMTVLAHTPNLVARVPGLAQMGNGLWLGVDLFMLISGWLLGGQLLREDRDSGLRPLRFFLKRWMRTLPPYYFMLLALYYLPNSREFRSPLPWDVILTHMTFTHVYAGRNEYMVSWSLCVEEHFYLVLPLIVVALRRLWSVRAVLVAVGTIEFASVVLRVLDFDSRESIPFPTHLRCHGLFLGLLFAYLSLRHRTLWERLERYLAVMGGVGIVGTIAVLVSIPPAPHPWMFVGAPTVGTWTLALVFVPCVHAGSSWSRFSFRGLAYFGGLTYSIYLTHNVIPRSVVELVGGGSGTPLGVIWRFFIMLCAALFLHHVVERPFLRLRGYLLAGARAATKA